MDLLDFNECTLYFEDAQPGIEKHLHDAAQHYRTESATPESELALLRAFFLAPDSLTVLVGLYRYYFYQHRLEDALAVAERALQISGRQIGLPDQWERIDEGALGKAAARSFGLMRFYLLALKAACVVLLRLGRIEESKARLRKLTELDSRDRLGVARILEVLTEYEAPDAETPAASAAASHLTAVCS